MRSALAVLSAVLLVVTLFAGTAVAQEQQVGGTVVVQEGEEVDGFRTFAGTVIVRGTVEGNLEAYAGSVVIEEGGTVDGELRAYSGDVRIAGRVTGSVASYAGSTELTETGVVDGVLGAFGGDVRIAGEVGDDVNVGADTVTLAETARIRGSLTYDADLNDQGGQVDGNVQQASDLALVPSPDLPLGSRILYSMLANALLGLLLLVFLPNTSTRVADRVVESPVVSAAAGVGVGILLPLLAVLFAITLVGLPLSLMLLLVLAAVLWVGTVYARLAIGAYLLTFTDVDSKYAPLAVGVVLVGLLVELPFVGWVVWLVVTALGVGALAVGGWDWYTTSERA
jgi:cytoskeletal protein CcmA (bactofilin family)